MKKATTRTTTAAAKTFEARDFSNLLPTLSFFLKKVFSKAHGSFSSANPSAKKKMKKIIPIALFVIGIGIIILLTSRTLTASGKQPTQNKQLAVSGPLATMPINKELSFPLLDAKGKEITSIKYTLENAELRNEIIVQGKRATAVQGRVFLILNIKIDNSFDKSLSINSRDYIRLSVNGNTEQLFAADIHNDPVSVQAISTKTTRLGFPINSSDTNLVLKVGEIKGEKTDINLSF